jgi:hypothetical protein
MTEEQRKNLFSKFTEISEEKETIDTMLPIELESTGETTYDTPRDESNLTYEQLIEDFRTFNKPAVMTLKTFQRLWNS